MTLTAGTKLGRYEIRSKIGEGGMGEVYLALDTELDRTVAIKILPEALASDRQRLQRFIQEAKAASALNHPHILTIHEIGTAGDSRFIATEFIDGDTLRQRISTGIKLIEIVDIGIQAAGALAAAHSAGIIHRDIKPENIMVRRDGYTKLLDFGLVKLTEPHGLISDPEAPTKAMVNTGAGTVMGTANYMSPEQAKGTSVDARTDLWSLGAVLYEMITGRAPFSGETPTETISLILQKEPAPLTRFAHDVPAELERIVTKTLTKDREERYQTAKDLVIDLRNLKRKLEVDAELDRTVPPEVRIAATTRTAGSDRSAPDTASGAVAATMPTGAAPAVSSAEYIVTGIKRHKTAAALVVVVFVIGAVGLNAYLHARNTEVAIESIAVLPFENQNHDPNVDWLSDGVTESIINSLTQLSNLRVIPRNSVFRYKGKDSDPLTVGKELGVRAVLTGRLLQRGDNLIVSSELVDVRDNKQLWGEQYSRKTADALAVQQEIAREISERLRPRLSGEEQRQVAKRETTNPEAYQLYLKGRYYLEKRTKEGTDRAIEYFQQAIDRDPNYALAFAGLADSYMLLVVAIPRSSFPPKEGFPKAKEAAMRALQIDDKLAEAHTSLAHIKLVYEWDWAGAEREFKRAIELDPNYATAHHWYGFDLAAVGRFDEAIIEIRKAQEIDPLSLIINANAGWIFYYARQYDQAIEQESKALEIDPNFAIAHGRLAQAYEQKGMNKEAVEEYLKAETLLGENQEEIAALRQAFTVAGMKGFWQKELGLALERSKRQLVPKTIVAGYYAHLGEREQAIQWLEKAYEERNVPISLKVDPRWDGLRSDPRFADLIRRVGL
jgi:eukaryotic-like serine/threonine-protein kinase